jgi:hypothetical protein
MGERANNGINVAATSPNTGSSMPRLEDPIVFYVAGVPAAIWTGEPTQYNGQRYIKTGSR